MSITKNQTKFKLYVLFLFAMISIVSILLVELTAFAEEGQDTFIEYKEEDVTRIFNDIKDDDWWIDAVQYVYDYNIMAGMGRDFYPVSSLTREQFAQVLYNHKGKPIVTLSNPFPDVQNSWYTNSVLWVRENDIANGNGDGTFGIGQNISREALAQMLYRYASLNGYDVSIDEGAIDGYADAANVSSWARNAMNWAVTQKIISGKGVGEDISFYKLDPQGNATRAECASMMMRLLNNK